MAIENSLAAVICIEDPLREEAPEVIRALHEAGLNKIVMMTGDSERTARAIAARVGVDASIIPRFCRKTRQDSLKKRRRPDGRLL